MSSFLTHIPTEHFNSERDAADRLNSDPLRVEVALSDASLAVLKAALPKRAVAETDIVRALKGLLSLEIVGVEGDTLRHYTENDMGEPELTPIPSRKFDVVGAAAWLPWAKGAAVHSPSLSLDVDRRFPLSSSQGNQPFRLSLAFGHPDALDVVVSSAFRVQAKRPKNGTAPKVKRLEKSASVGTRRGNHLAAVPAALPADVVGGAAITPPRVARKPAATAKRSHGDSIVAGSDDEGDNAAGAGGVSPVRTRSAAKRVRCAEPKAEVVMPLSQVGPLSLSQAVPFSQGAPVSLSQAVPFSQPLIASQGSAPGSPLASLLSSMVGEPLRLSQSVGQGALTPMFSYAGLDHHDLTPLASLDMDSVGNAFGPF